VRGSGNLEYKTGIRRIKKNLSDDSVLFAARSSIYFLSGAERRTAERISFPYTGGVWPFDVATANKHQPEGSSPTIRIKTKCKGGEMGRKERERKL